jgi:hypothetical protein
MTITNGYATLNDFKAYLFPSANYGTAEDATMEAAIESASRIIDAHTNRRFYSDTTVSARVYYANTPIRCTVDDFSTTSGLIIKTDTGDNGTYDQTWASDEYILEPINAEIGGVSGQPYNTIVATIPKLFPVTGRRPRIQVTAKWGWASVPDTVRQACLVQAARLFRRAQTPEGFAAGESFGAIRVSTKLDPDVQMLLAPFRRQGGQGLVIG